MFMILLLIHCIKCDQILTTEFMEGQQQIVQGWLDNSQNVVTSQLTCDESMVGPFLGEIDNNIFKKYSNISPHYEVLITLDILFRGYWIQQNNYVNILLDGQQVEQIQNIQTSSFVIPNTYCSTNIVNLQPQKQNLKTLMIQFSHQQPDLWLDIQGSFWCSSTDPLACEKIALKNLVIITKECHQTCQTCNGPNNNNCLSCPSGSLVQGTCTCSSGVAYQFQCITSCPQYYQNQNGQCILECSLNCVTCSNNKCTQCITNYYNVNGQCYQYCPNHAIMQGQNCVDYSELSQYGSNYIDQFFTNGVLDLYQVQQTISVEKKSNSGSGQGQNLDLQPITDYYSIYQNKLLLGGFLIWSDAEYFFKYTDLPAHNNLVIYMTAYFIDNWSDDPLKIYVDGDDDYQTQIKSANQKSNLMLRNSKDRIENIKLSVKHTSSSLTIGIYPKIAANNYDASFAISDLFILADNCDNNCIECGSTACVTCDNGYELVNKKCTLCDSGNCNQCSTGFYLNTSNNKCKACQNNCLQCTSSSSCQQCAQGYYIQNGVCIPCSQNCQACTQSSTCATCKVGYILDINNQCNTCNPNQLVINNTCQDCSYKCLTCSLSLQNCVLCQTNRINPPLCNCEDGYYEEQNSCIKCSLQCETCTSQTNCIACAANRISSPLCVCPPDSFDNLSIGNAYCSTCDLAFGVAQFSENLQEIYIDFGQPIQNLQINCQQILTQEILDKIGQKQICYIRDGIIVIELDSFSTIQPGEGIQIIPYQLKLANCPFVTQNFDKIILNIPKKDIIPEIIFNTTLIEYSNCQDSFVQISKTVNDGGRPLKFLNWQVLDQNSNHFTMLEDYLNKNLNEPIITIPQNITFPQDSYTLTLTFTNFLNYRGQQSIQLQNYKGPVIISTFNNYSTYYNYQDINIFNDPYLLVCQSNVQYKNKTINLRISSQTNYLFKQLEILNQSVIDIGLEPYYFSFIGVYYITFDITIFYTLDQKEYSITKVFIYQMEILEKEWVYQIQNQNRIIGFNQELSINLDIINPNNQTDQINFDIDWMCVNVLINKECKDSNGNFITFNNSQIQLFQERTFIPFQVIIITAQSIIGGKVYQSSTTIQFIETNLPQFKILINNQTQFEKINYYDEIYVELEYPIQKNPDDLYFTMQMGVDEFTTQSYRFYNYKLKFRVREKIQNLDYSTLNLKFSIYNPDFYVASTNQIQIYLNVPPKQCVLSSNTTGSVSLLDNILVTVKNCVDDEYPLKFGFVIYDNKDDFVQDQIQGQVVKGEILQNFSSSNNIVIRLYESDFNLIQVFVKDTYYGLSNFTLQFNTTYTNVSQDQILQIISQPKSKNQQFIDYMTILGYYTLEKIPIPQQIGALSLNFSKNYTKFEDLVLDMDIQINYRLIHTQGFIQTRSQIDSYLRYVQDQLVLIDQNILNLFKYTVAIKYNSKMELLKLILIDRLYKYVNFISQLFYLNCELKDISNGVDQNIINLKIVDTIDQLLSILTKIQFINDDTILVNSNMIQLQVNKLSRLRVINKFGQIIDYSTSVSRQLTQSDQLEYIYNLAIYRTNPYQNSSEFKQSYSQSTQKPLYRPTLTLQGQPINQTLPVAYSFNHTETQLCVQKLNNLWQAQSCKTKVLLNETICVCEHISATTLVDAFFNAQGQIFRIFSYDSIQKIFNYEIEKIVFVYIVLFYTLTYIWLMYKSNQLDLMKTNPEEFNTKVHPTEKIDEQVIIHDNQLQLHEIETKTQISKIQARISLKRQYSSNRLKAKEDTNVTFNNEPNNNSFHQKRLGSQQSLFSKNQQKKTEDKTQICQEDNFDILSPGEYLNSVEPQNSPKLFQKISSEDTKEQSTNLKQKIENGEITTIKGLVLYFKYFHVFFGIYFRYCEEQNRILRCTLVYMSLLGQICILVVFGNQLNLNTILVLSFTQNVFGFIYKKLMSFLLNTNNLFIKSIGYNVTLLQCGLFYFIILASSCNYESIMVANLWAASYICSFFLDYFFYSSIIMVIMYIVNLRIHKYNNLKKLSQIILDKPQYAFFFGE